MKGLTSSPAAKPGELAMLNTEGAGMSPETLAVVDLAVKIPVRGGVDPLNLAAASALASWGTAPPVVAWRKSDGSIRVRTPWGLDPSHGAVWCYNMSSVSPKFLKEVGTKIPGITRVMAYLWTSLSHDNDPPPLVTLVAHFSQQQA